MKLEGRSALVTGGGSGIGRAIARRVAAEGASVLVAELNEETGAAATRGMEDAGGRALSLRADTGREEDVQAAVAATVEAFGRLDILVNNAGIASPVYTWESVIAGNL